MDTHLRSVGGPVCQGGVRQRADDDLLGRERRVRFGVGRGAEAGGEAEGEAGAEGAAGEGKEGEGREEGEEEDERWRRRREEEYFAVCLV